MMIRLCVAVSVLFFFAQARVRTKRDEDLASGRWWHRHKDEADTGGRGAVVSATPRVAGHLLLQSQYRCLVDPTGRKGDEGAGGGGSEVGR